MTYELEKNIWTDNDFDVMGWHDNHIYRIGIAVDLEMDIDYILKWNAPELEGFTFTFWVAPATLVFKNVQNFNFEFDVGIENCFEIENIQREKNNQWTIITLQGNMRFTSDGYEQFIRQRPSLQFGQTIPFIERNGYSLDRTTNQENPNIKKDDVVEYRRKNVEHYENAKKRHSKRQELEKLIKARENGEIDTKTYLLRKKEINELLFSYDFFLKGTQFENW